MSKGRLTRQELGWLLTQEAAGAAERLRVGVQVLKTAAPPPMLPVEGDPAAPQLDATLDALDDAMKMLSSLHNKPSAVRGRRGRIDLASLIWEVAPDARVSIEPGSGTEVFGDEAELRRMLNVLVGHGTGAGSHVNIRREGDEVRVAVVLGPDSSATAETERAWVSRMAIRYGGRCELEAGAEVLSLPAYDAAERSESAALRKELDEARKQGEAYARELAAAFSQEEGTSRTPSTIPPAILTPPIERFGTVAKLAGGIAAELRQILSPAARQVPPARAGDSSPVSVAEAATEREREKWDTVRRSLGRAQEFVGALASVGEVDPSEMPTDIDLVEATRHAVATLSGRAERSGVSVKIGGDRDVTVRAAPRATAVLLRELIAQAIAASPPASEVHVGLTMGPAARVTIDDAGPSLPTAARRGFAGLDIEPGTYGRSTSVPLFIAGEIAAWQGIAFELADPPTGGLRVQLTFPR